MAVEELGSELGSVISQLAWGINDSAGRLLREQLGILEHIKHDGLDENILCKAKTHGFEYALLGDWLKIVRDVDFFLFQENKELLLTVVAKVCLIELKARKQISRPAESYAREHMRKNSPGSAKPQNRTPASGRTATN